MIFSRLIGTLAFVLAFQFSVPSVASADEVLDWNTIAIRTTQAPPTAIPAFLQPRALAIVHASVFDALNEIERDYKPIHVDDPAPRRASRRAAVVQAAYKALVTMFPGQAAALDSDRATSLAAITDSAEAIQRGITWGDQVAVAILAWRQIIIPPAPPYLGSLDVGKWRPTPRPDPMNPGAELPGLPAAGVLLATLPTFVIPSSSSFRPGGPPPLTSFKYAKDFIEVKLVGDIESAFRTADQTPERTLLGLIRSGCGLESGRSERVPQATLEPVEKRAPVCASEYGDGRLGSFGLGLQVPLLELAADYSHSPRWYGLESFDDRDPEWAPLIVTPPYPDYYSGHQSISGAAQEVLTAAFGKQMGFEAFSEGLPGVTRSWRSFSAAADEANMSRIWAGIHFRFAQTDSRIVAEKIAQYVLKHAARPMDDDD